MPFASDGVRLFQACRIPIVPSLSIWHCKWLTPVMRRDSCRVTKGQSSSHPTQTTPGWFPADTALFQVMTRRTVYCPIDKFVAEEKPPMIDQRDRRSSSSL